MKSILNIDGKEKYTLININTSLKVRQNQDKSHFLPVRCLSLY